MKEHWEQVYDQKNVEELGWYESSPGPSLELIEACRFHKGARVLNVGAGATTLVDELLDLGYCYNATNSDGIYGSPPPAIGYLILKGPHVIAGLGNSVHFNNARLLEYINLGMSSFMGFT